MAEDRAIQGGWKRFVPQTTPRSDVSAGPPDATPAPLESTSVASEPVGTFVSSGAVFEGRLSLRGDFFLDTQYRGRLETNGTIIIGPNGSVEGDIRAREVVIRGAVVGNVIAPRQLVVESSARLHGDIETACLEIQKHAFFKGNTTMSMPQMEHVTAPTPRTAEPADAPTASAAPTAP